MKSVLFTSAVAATAMAFASSATAESVTILGGGIKGGPYAMAVAFSKILKDKSNIAATPQSTKGMVAQARILAKGDAQFAFALGGPLGAWAHQGLDRFKKEGPKPELRAIMSYPGGYLQWLTLDSSGIKKLSDLKGKKVSVGGASSTTQTFARKMLPIVGLAKGSYKESTPGFTGGLGQLKDGAVDAHLTFGQPGMSAVQELAALKQFRIIQMNPADVETVVKKFGPGLTVGKIPVGTYGKNQKNTATAHAVAVQFGFSTTSHTSADTVYKVTKALFENLDALKGATKAAKVLNLENACVGLAFPLHEGAKKYYKEIGAKGC